MLQILPSMNQNSNTTNQNTITYDLNIFKGSFSKKGKILGIDTGKKFLGLSVSDTNKRVAVAHKTIVRKKYKEDMQNLRISLERNNIISIVIGLPLNKDGTKGPRSQSAITFAIGISKYFNLPIYFWDERFSTIGIEKEMIRNGVKRKNIKKTLDESSATWILQAALDAANNSLTQNEK